MSGQHTSIANLLKFVSSAVGSLQLPARAKTEARRDRRGLPTLDPGPESVVAACTAWLAHAQDCSASADGGVARDFSLVKGWASSYPETTGYIVPTVLEVARRRNDPVLRERARRMLDWLVAIQFPNGGIQGGKVDAEPRVPVTFNTGQVLIGLAAGVTEFGDVYRESMNRAAAWLRDSLDPDGCWRKHPTPFARPGEKAYETHVSWGLFEAALLEPDRGYGEAGLRQVHWALTKQRPNGWFDSCCLDQPAMPLTHTLGYVLRGILEAWRLDASTEILRRAQRLADALVAVQEPDGRLAGRFDSTWTPAVDWACLTGICQICGCWWDLYRITGEARYREAARRGNAWVRRTIRLEGDPDVVGGVKGSFPVDGAYGEYQYLNWAAKFCIDANLLELDLR
jgi:hypothetical protein